ncbi:MAG: DedA family protein [Alphaproteobacteria bacterium]|nr:DedA family protein [Alphaproteobacteria bacterium]
MEVYAALALGAFLAATLLPLSSEAMLAALVAARGHDLAILFAIALVANTAGSCMNWLLGRFLLHWQDRRWFPVKHDALARAQAWFGRWGSWSLLLAWLPVVGDPLTLAAGVLRVDFLRFVLLTGLGKAARYAAVIWLAAKI